MAVDRDHADTRAGSSRVLMISDAGARKVTSVLTRGSVLYLGMLPVADAACAFLVVAAEADADVEDLGLASRATKSASEP